MTFKSSGYVSTREINTEMSRGVTSAFSTDDTAFLSLANKSAGQLVSIPNDIYGGTVKRTVTFPVGYLEHNGYTYFGYHDNAIISSLGVPSFGSIPNNGNIPDLIALLDPQPRIAGFYTRWHDSQNVWTNWLRFAIPSLRTSSLSFLPQSLILDSQRGRPTLTYTKGNITGDSSGYWYVTYTRTAQYEERMLDAFDTTYHVPTMSIIIETIDP